MAIRFNESVAKTAEEARKEEFAKNWGRSHTEAHGPIHKQLAEQEAALKQKLQKQLKKSQSKVDRTWNCITCQQAGTHPQYPRF